jgi:hypothetical protein
LLPRLPPRQRAVGGEAVVVGYLLFNFQQRYSDGLKYSLMKCAYANIDGYGVLDILIIFQAGQVLLQFSNWRHI